MVVKWPTWYHKQLHFDMLTLVKLASSHQINQSQQWSVVELFAIAQYYFLNEFKLSCETSNLTAVILQEPNLPISTIFSVTQQWNHLEISNFSSSCSERGFSQLFYCYRTIISPVTITFTLFLVFDTGSVIPIFHGKRPNHVHRLSNCIFDSASATSVAIFHSFTKPWLNWTIDCHWKMVVYVI